MRVPIVTTTCIYLTHAAHRQARYSAQVTGRLLHGQARHTPKSRTAYFFHACVVFRKACRHLLRRLQQSLLGLQRHYIIALYHSIISTSINHSKIITFVAFIYRVSCFCSIILNVYIIFIRFRLLVPQSYSILLLNSIYNSMGWLPSARASGDITKGGVASKGKGGVPPRRSAEFSVLLLE